MTRKRQEMIAGVVIVAVAAIAVGLAFSYDDPMAGTYATLTTTFVPILWGSFTLVLGLIYTVATVVVRPMEDSSLEELQEPLMSDIQPQSDNQPERAHLTAGQGPRTALVTAGTAIMVVVYVLLLRRLNFVLITCLLLFGLFSLYRATSKWWLNAIIAVIAAVAVYGVFVRIMRIPL